MYVKIMLIFSLTNLVFLQLFPIVRHLVLCIFHLQVGDMGRTSLSEGFLYYGPLIISLSFFVPIEKITFVVPLT